MQKIIPLLAATYITTTLIFLSNQDFNQTLPSVTDFWLYAGLAISYGLSGFFLLKEPGLIAGLLGLIIILAGTIGLIVGTVTSTFLFALAITLSLGLATAAMGAGIKYIATYDRSEETPNKI
jgi:hypothetical protein